MSLESTFMLFGILMYWTDNQLLVGTYSAFLTEDKSINAGSPTTRAIRMCVIRIMHITNGVRGAESLCLKCWDN